MVVATPIEASSFPPRATSVSAPKFTKTQLALFVVPAVFSYCLLGLGTDLTKRVRNVTDSGLLTASTTAMMNRTYVCTMVTIGAASILLIYIVGQKIPSFDDRLKLGGLALVLTTAAVIANFTARAKDGQVDSRLKAYAKQIYLVLLAIVVAPVAIVIGYAMKYSWDKREQIAKGADGFSKSFAQR